MDFETKRRLVLLKKIQQANEDELLLEEVKQAVFQALEKMERVLKKE